VGAWDVTTLLIHLSHPRRGGCRHADTGSWLAVERS
jgi:hypothetical protein